MRIVYILEDKEDLEKVRDAIDEVMQRHPDNSSEWNKLNELRCIADKLIHNVQEVINEQANVG